MEWFYQEMGADIGPVSSADLKQKALRGVIGRDTYVRPSNGDWVLAERVKGLFDVAPQTATAAVAVVEDRPRYTPPPESNSNGHATTPAVSTPSVSPQVLNVVVKDFDMAFGSMVWFMVKWTVAAIPAAMILGFIVWVMVAIAVGTMAAMGIK